MQLFFYFINLILFVFLNQLILYLLLSQNQLNQLVILMFDLK